MCPNNTRSLIPCRPYALAHMDYTLYIELLERNTQAKWFKIYMHIKHASENVCDDLNARNKWNEASRCDKNYNFLQCVYCSCTASVILFSRIMTGFCDVRPKVPQMSQFKGLWCVHITRMIETFNPYTLTCLSLSTSVLAYENKATHGSQQF